MKGSKDYHDYSWFACHNVDELVLDEALLLLKEGIRIYEICRAKNLK